MIIRPVRGRACIESQGLISAEEGLIYSPVLSGGSRARGQLRQLSPDQAALSRDTTWRYQARNSRGRNSKKPREDGRIIKLSDVPTDEEDDTLRGDDYGVLSVLTLPVQQTWKPSLVSTLKKGRQKGGEVRLAITRKTRRRRRRMKVSL